jgi:hypothetical protein
MTRAELEAVIWRQRTSLTQSPGTARRAVETILQAADVYAGITAAARAYDGPEVTGRRREVLERAVRRRYRPRRKDRT